MTFDSLSDTLEDSAQHWDVAGPDEITAVGAIPIAPVVDLRPPLCDTLPPPAGLARGSVADIIPDDERVGGVVGKYRIIKPIAQGGMGTVYLGEHELLGCKVAIKFIKASLCRDERALERFLAEAIAATHIDHPGVVDVIDYGHHDELGAYFIMEYLDGEELADRMNFDGIVPLRKAVSIASQVALTLAAAHDVGIVHRDVKPENIFLVRDPAARGGERIKLFDFGVAKFTRATEGLNLAETRLGALLGTPRYMSPEQCRGQGGIDARADIYALGCVLYEMVCGRAPFQGGISEVLMAHITDAPRRPRSINPALPPALESLILSMLAKAKDDRPASMSDVAVALADIDLDDLAAGSERIALPSPASLVGNRGRIVVAPTIAADTGLARGYQIAHTVALAHPPSRISDAAGLAPVATGDDDTAPVLPLPAPTAIVRAAVPTRVSPAFAGLLVAIALLCAATFFAATLA